MLETVNFENESSGTFTN